MNRINCIQPTLLGLPLQVTTCEMCTGTDSVLRLEALDGLSIWLCTGCLVEYWDVYNRVGPWPQGQS